MDSIFEVFSSLTRTKTNGDSEVVDGATDRVFSITYS